MKLAILSTAIAATTAFAPTTTHSSKTVALQSTTEEVADIPADIPQPTPAVAAINGWVPDETAKCYGLPGSVAPTGYFDPLGFAQAGITLNEVKRNREAEVMHGRVAMMATVGYLVGEAFPGPFGLTGPANDQLAQLPTGVLPLLGAMIGACELKRAQTGWVEPDFGNWSKTLWKLRDEYYPGDLGFDPLVSLNLLCIVRAEYIICECTESYLRRLSFKHTNAILSLHSLILQYRASNQLIRNNSLICKQKNCRMDDLP